MINTQGRHKTCVKTWKDSLLLGERGGGDCSPCLIFWLSAEADWTIYQIHVLLLYHSTSANIETTQYKVHAVHTVWDKKAFWRTVLFLGKFWGCKYFSISRNILYSTYCKMIATAISALFSLCTLHIVPKYSVVLRSRRSPKPSIFGWNWSRLILIKW